MARNERNGQAVPEQGAGGDRKKSGGSTRQKQVRIRRKAKPIYEPPPNGEPECWKPVSHWPNYECSCLGRIRNRRTLRVLSPVTIHNGAGIPYHRVTLYDGSKKNDTFRLRHILVSRIVAKEHCKGRTDEANYVHHNDDNTLNNRADNLRWVTQSENIRLTWKYQDMVYDPYAVSFDPAEHWQDPKPEPVPPTEPDEEAPF